MIYNIAADLVMLLHFGFILYVLLGAVTLLSWPRLIWLHLSAVLWGAYVELSGRICPLTYLESSLRIAAGESGYSGSFIQEYLQPIIYPEGLNEEIQLWLGGAVIVINLLMYVLVWKLRKRISRLS